MIGTSNCSYRAKPGYWRTARESTDITAIMAHEVTEELTGLRVNALDREKA